MILSAKGVYDDIVAINDRCKEIFEMYNADKITVVYRHSLERTELMSEVFDLCFDANFEVKACTRMIRVGMSACTVNIYKRKTHN